MTPPRGESLLRGRKVGHRRQMRKIGVAPAEGERRAVSGFLHQYRVAASIILPHMRDGTLKWIRISDPEAGRVDDFQLGSESRVDADQVKWSQFSGPFTFNDLVREARPSPSLLRQLADGWTRLRATHNGQHIVVHLVTNQTPSVHDKVPAGSRKAIPPHFAGFLAQAWNSFRESPSGGVPEAWGAAWEVLRRETGLAKDAFERFAYGCELECGWRFPNERTVPARERGMLEKDIRELVLLR